MTCRACVNPRGLFLHLVLTAAMSSFFLPSKSSVRDRKRKKTVDKKRVSPRRHFTVLLCHVIRWSALIRDILVSQRQEREVAKRVPKKVKKTVKDEEIDSDSDLERSKLSHIMFGNTCMMRVYCAVWCSTRVERKKPNGVRILADEEEEEEEETAAEKRLRLAKEYIAQVEEEGTVLIYAALTVT